MQKLEIQNLKVEVSGKKIIDNVSLTIKSGEIHAIMGPNGSGKSTLCYAVMGHPNYKITGGDILLNGKSILKLKADERAKLGIFLGFQNPSELPGVSVAGFMHSALKSIGKEINSIILLHEKIAGHLAELGLPTDLERGFNEGYSGGEKKRAEIMQMQLLQPKFAFLDEPDSGTDIDGLKLIGNIIQKSDAGQIIVTHQTKMLNYVRPTHVHIIINGKIAASGGSELASKIEAGGFKQFEK